MDACMDGWMDKQMNGLWKLGYQKEVWGTWLAQLVEYMTLDLRAVSSSLTLGEEIT